MASDAPLAHPRRIPWRMSDDRLSAMSSRQVSRLNINSRFELSMKVVLSAREDPRGLRSVMVGLSELSVWVSLPPP